jgi:hypothetical protein
VLCFLNSSLSLFQIEIETKDKIRLTSPLFGYDLLLLLLLQDICIFTCGLGYFDIGPLIPLLPRRHCRDHYQANAYFVLVKVIFLGEWKR